MIMTELAQCVAWGWTRCRAARAPFLAASVSRMHCFHFNKEKREREKLQVTATPKTWFLCSWVCGVCSCELSSSSSALSSPWWERHLASESSIELECDVSPTGALSNTPTPRMISASMTTQLGCRRWMCRHSGWTIELSNANEFQLQRLVTTNEY